MTTANLSFPWFFAPMCQNFTAYSRFSDEPYEGVFLYTTEQDGKVYANMAATDMNIAIRIKWREEYSSGQELHHIDNAGHAVKLMLAREHLSMMKGNFMQLDEIKEGSVVFGSCSSSGLVKVNVPLSSTGEDTVQRYIENFFEGMFFSPTREEWEARKLGMGMPTFMAHRLVACDLKKYGFDKPLDRSEAKSDVTFAPRLFGLCRPAEVGMEGLTTQTNDGLHGLDFPEYPKEFKWYKDVSIQVVFMPMALPK